MRLTRFRKTLAITLFSGCLASVCEAGTPALPPKADGKLAREWLALAAQQFAGLAESKLYDPYTMLDPIAQQQVLIGDRAGANHTAELMETRLAKSQANPMDQYELMETISTDISANRTANAQKAVDALAAANGSAFLGIPTVVAQYLVRLNQTDRAFSIVSKNKDIQDRERLYEQIAWVLYMCKNNATGDRALSLALAGASQPVKNPLLTDHENLAKLLIFRGRVDEAFKVATDIKQPAESEIHWSEMILFCSDMKDLKQFKKLTALISSSWATHAPFSTTSGGMVIRTMAQSGDIPDAQKLLSDLRKVEPDDVLTQTELDRLQAEFYVWDHDFPAAATLLEKIAPQEPTRRGRGDIDSSSFFFNISRAYAMADQDQDALKMAEQSVGSGDVAMIEVISCLARVGHSDKAIEALNKMRKDYRAKTIEKLAAGWAIAKDSKGLQQWINGIEDPIEKGFAYVGAAEGLLRTELKDLFNAPPSRIAT